MIAFVLEYKMFKKQNCIIGDGSADSSPARFSTSIYIRTGYAFSGTVIKEYTSPRIFFHRYYTFFLLKDSCTF